MKSLKNFLPILVFFLALGACANHGSKTKMMNNDQKMGNSSTKPMMNDKAMNDKAMNDKMMNDKAMNDKMMDGKMMDNKMMMMDPDMKSWPEPARMAAKEMMGKYSKADIMSDNLLVWMNKGQWKMIMVSKETSKHLFPVEHMDMLMQTINYKVPENKMSDLGMFDGSVTFDRTQGTMSARCDKEENNMLALNLANDIVTGKKSVEEARKSYGEMIKERMNGGNPMYMQKLTFSMQPNAADPDMSTIQKKM